MKKITCFLLIMSTSQAALSGNLMTHPEVRSHEMSDSRGQYHIEYEDPTQVVLKIRNIDVRNLDEFSVTFKDSETQSFHQQEMHQFENSWYKSLVLAHSDKDAVCRHFLGAHAQYAGRYTHQYLRHLRYKLSFIRLGSQQDYSLRREWGGVRLIDKLWCRVELKNEQGF